MQRPHDDDPGRRGRQDDDGASRRLDDLEIKASYAEDLLEQLNLLVYRQQQQIDRLQRQVALLRQQAPEAGPGAPRDPRDELPPHY